MKRIDTTQIVDPTSEQPFTGKSLSFKQDYDAENFAAMVKAFIIQNKGSYSLTIPYVISGCAVTDSNKDVAAGEIFYGGNFFTTTALNGTTNTAQFVLTKSQDATADPVEFTDGSMKTVHDIYIYVATDTDTAGDFASTDLVSAYGASKLSSGDRTSSQSITSNTYIDVTGTFSYTTPDDGKTRTWLITAKSNLNYQVTGVGEGGYVEIYNVTGAVQLDECLTVLVSNSIVNYESQQTVVAHRIIALAPNVQVKMRIKTYNGGTVDFRNNSFSIVEV